MPTLNCKCIFLAVSGSCLHVGLFDSCPVCMWLLSCLYVIVAHSECTLQLKLSPCGTIKLILVLSLLPVLLRGSDLGRAPGSGPWTSGTARWRWGRSGLCTWSPPGWWSQTQPCQSKDGEPLHEFVCMACLEITATNAVHVELTACRLVL